jgi:BirA family biotin operon repressor/biotin-[acetyl-CoA-carboxylase] ligase
VNPAAPPGTWRLQIFEVLPSTSELCRTLADAGEPEGLAVLARRQTQGRGSRGRDWQSPSGNLSLSILLRPREAARDAAQWALLAGVALAETLGPYLMPTGVEIVRTPSSSAKAEDPRLWCSGTKDMDGRPSPTIRRQPPALRLKWPNDVLLDGRKLAGILIDSATDEQGGLRYVIIGIGANLAVAPDLPDRAAVSLSEFAMPPKPDAFAPALLERIAHWRQVRLLEGFSPVRAAWHDRAQEVGSHMTIKHDGQIFGGTYSGLGEDGSLLLQAGGRVRAFTTGEVLLGGPR